MHPLTELFHHCGSLLASPESLTSMAMRSTLAGAKLPCIAGLGMSILSIGTIPLMSVGSGGIAGTGGSSSGLASATKA